jgi:hypothetical protein
MSKFLSYLLFILSIVSVSLFADSAFAITVIEPVRANLPVISTDPSVTIAKIIQYFIMIAGVLAVMAITW